MSLIAVDLAARFSAACWLMNNTRLPVQQWDSWQKTENEFITLITAPFRSHPTPQVLAVEDLPPRVPWMTTVKDVCRLQGRIIERMSQLGHLDLLLFVQPAQWRAHFPGLKQGTGPDAVVPVSLLHGYTPPELTDRLEMKPGTNKPVAGQRATIRKVQTDYCAAFLIGRWAVDTYATNGSFDTARTSRYLKV